MTTLKPLKTFYKNRLPHIAPVGATFFVTFRLHDSLPLNVLRQIQEMRKDLESSVKHFRDHELKINSKDHSRRFINQSWRIFKKFDHQLDNLPYGDCYLRIPAVAEIIRDRLFDFDNVHYSLHAFSIMPNHVHILFDTSIQLDSGLMTDVLTRANYTQLDKIMQLIKGGSARYANQYLGRSGSFWFKDSYDHYIRNKKEWKRVACYILMNPVSAGFVEHWWDWSFSYCKYDIEES